MRVIDLFSGIGGFRLGYEKATNKEWETVYSCDIDKWATAVYNHNFHEDREPMDIRQVRIRDIPKASLICGGFPCQSFSLAGKRKGFEDTRGTLFYEILRIARAKRVKYLFLENVKGLINHDAGISFATILQSLDESGYDAQWQVLNSKWWVPQNRERVFIIANLRTAPRPQVFPLGESQTGNIQEPEVKVARTLDATYSKNHQWGEYITQTIRAEHHNTVDVHFIPALAKIATYGKDSQGQRVYSTQGISQTLAGNSGGRGGKTGLYTINRSQRDFLKKEDTAFTVDSGVSVGTDIRRLTPLECERLQGFPDNWTRKGTIAGKEVPISDSQRYKMCGNAVTTNVIQAIVEKWIG